MRFRTDSKKLKAVLFIGMLNMFLSIEALADRQELVEQLDSLLDTLNIPHKSDFNSMIDATQRWRRVPGQERWQLPDIDINDETKAKVTSLLKSIGIIDELKPSQKEFDYVLLLGATVPRMQQRLEHLARLWQSGIRYNQLVFLTGQRPLTPTIDNIDELIARTSGHLATDDSRPTTESEAAVMLFQSTPLMPEMRAKPVYFVDSPRYWNQTRWQRPNTRDTLKTWLHQNPKAGSVLVMSEQPSALYQQEVVRQELPETFSVEMAAQTAPKDTRLAILLDALALWLHNVQKTMTGLYSEKVESSAITIPPTRH